MGKLIKYSIKWKLCEAKKKGNTREILYYTDKLKEVAIYMQGVQDERDERARLKKKKPKKTVVKTAKFIDPKVLALERRDLLIQNITRAEVYFKLLLTKLNIEYTFQYVKFVSNYQFYILDFYLPKYSLYLDPKNEYCLVKDKEKMEYFEKTINIKYGHIKSVLIEINNIKKPE
jgi:hypothetical protein